ncbi:hypothetical protein ABW21_db0205741 [Orbilia brochopaga]|nr:hypothetical protein ABW21_db0205741 [Drechslerella brochopaga]
MIFEAALQRQQVSGTPVLRRDDDIARLAQHQSRLLGLQRIRIHVQEHPVCPNLLAASWAVNCNCKWVTGHETQNAGNTHREHELVDGVVRADSNDSRGAHVAWEVPLVRELDIERHKVWGRALVDLGEGQVERPAGRWGESFIGDDISEGRHFEFVIR